MTNFFLPNDSQFGEKSNKKVFTGKIFFGLCGLMAPRSLPHGVWIWIIYIRNYMKFFYLVNYLYIFFVKRESLIYYFLKDPEVRKVPVKKRF